MNPLRRASPQIFTRVWSIHTPRRFAPPLSVEGTWSAVGEISAGEGTRSVAGEIPSGEGCPTGRGVSVRIWKCEKPGLTDAAAQRRGCVPFSFHATVRRGSSLNVDLASRQKKRPSTPGFPLKPVQSHGAVPGFSRSRCLTSSPVRALAPACFASRVRPACAPS